MTIKNLANQNIILGICGGIAAYKSAILARNLMELGASVRVVMTRNAQEFITPLSLQALTTNPVHTDLLDPAQEAGMGHIELARWADLLLIAPTTANTLAKLAHGLADDLLSTLYLATPARKVIVPAMNQQMWRHQATQDNVQKVIEHGAELMPPAHGLQACGDDGPGRLPDPAEIISYLQPKLKTNGKRVLITAGPTQEAIDPVRYISNKSSGKMGYALAKAFVQAGHQVTLVSGPTSLSVPNHVQFISVISAFEMHEQVMMRTAEHDIFISTAAVADYRLKEIQPQKIKKNSEQLTLELIKNPDILADVASAPGKIFTVGFAAETNDVIAYAKQKLDSKKVDLIIANDVSRPDAGFDVDTNQVAVITQSKSVELPLMDKLSLGHKLCSIIVEAYHAKNSTQNS